VGFAEGYSLGEHLLLGIFTPDECNLTILGGSTLRGIFCTMLSEGPGFADAVEGGLINPWVFARGACIMFADGPEFADAVEEA